MLEQGPVMILTFTAQQLKYNDVETSQSASFKSSLSLLLLLQEELESVVYIWALCRDQSIYDPKTAWRIIEFGIQASARLLI